MQARRWLGPAQKHAARLCSFVLPLGPQAQSNPFAREIFPQPKARRATEDELSLFVSVFLLWTCRHVIFISFSVAYMYELLSYTFHIHLL